MSEPQRPPTLEDLGDALRHVGAAMFDAWRPVFEHLIDAFKAMMMPVLTGVAGAIRQFMAAWWSDAVITQWVIERLGITEVDVRRIDRSAGVVVLWNRRRIPIDWDDMGEWASR